VNREERLVGRILRLSPLSSSRVLERLGEMMYAADEIRQLLEEHDGTLPEWGEELRAGAEMVFDRANAMMKRLSS
jgi:hypothetical protein